MTAETAERTKAVTRNGNSRSAMTAAKDSVRERVRRTSPGAAALVGAAVGGLAGVVLGQRTRTGGNEISGDVAVHLLKKVELLTIRLQVRQARRGGPAEIDVRRVPADASSRP
jgi:hypothetical protein